MGVGQAIENIRGAVAAEFLAPGDETIAEAQQIIANVDRRGDPVLAMQRLAAKASLMQFEEAGEPAGLFCCCARISAASNGWPKVGNALLAGSRIVLCRV